MDNIRAKKNALYDLARSHITIEAGTALQYRIFMQLDQAVNELLRLGVSEIEIRNIISEGERQGRTGINQPTFETINYLTPAQRQQDDDNDDNDDDDDDYDDDARRQRILAGVNQNIGNNEERIENANLGWQQLFINPNVAPNAAPSWQQLFAANRAAAPAVAARPAVVAPVAPLAPAAARVAVAQADALAAARAAVAQADALVALRAALDAAPVPTPVPAPAPTMTNRYEFLNDEPEDLDSKDLEQYKDMMRCNICLTNIKDVRLSPCDHMFCKSCVRALISRGETKCPICRKTFNNVHKTYNNKYLKYKIKYFSLKNKQ